MIYLGVRIMELNEKGKQANRRPWFLFLIMIFSITIVFGGPVKPLIAGSIPWLLTIFAFFVSLAGGIWLGLRKAKGRK
jgi:uncharacterized membrane protein YeiH